MAKYKQMNLIDRIYQLKKQGLSQRRIASELGLSNNKVGRYLNKKPGTPVQGGSVSNEATHGVAQFEATRGKFSSLKFLPGTTKGVFHVFS